MPDDTDESRSIASEVYITAELNLRSPKPKDWGRAKSAVQDLAARIAEDSEQILPCFVQLAMQMTGGVSAGLSLYETEPAPGIFRWHHLTGVLARFEGTTTPRDDSPCGVTLDQASPVLTRHSERMYKWISDAGICIPEVLLVPLFLGGPEPLGTLWVVSDTENYFDSGDARLTMEIAGFVGVALRMQRNKERLRTVLQSAGERAR
ncbi:MAG TPA: GAF domain-containing protein [Micropepsaceae bacterium]|nr:GAF domain-containing protein [Micropepsaceae bacterium]